MSNPPCRLYRKSTCLAQVVLLLFWASACSSPEIAGSARDRFSDRLHGTAFFALSSPPEIIAKGPGGVVRAVRLAAQLDPALLQSRSDSQRVSADALPFLAETPEGRRFLGMSGPRAIARGAPAERCPSLAAGAGPDRGAATETALTQCLAGLPANARGCGCELLALGSVLTAPQDGFAFATGVTARLRAPALGIDGLTVAEALGDGRTLIRGADGPIAVIAGGAGEAVEISFVSGAVYEGRSRAVGFRRGRMAERIYAADASGNRLSLLIGFSPAELDAYAGAWLAGRG